MLVYKITNNVNGHGYIGITQCALAKRWREHLCAARTGSAWTHLNKQYPPIKRGRGARDDVVSEEARQTQKDTLAKHHAAIIAAAHARTGKRSSHAKLPVETVREIFFYQDSLSKTAAKFGVSKKMVLLIKQRKAHTYLTQGL